MCKMRSIKRTYSRLSYLKTSLIEKSKIFLMRRVYFLKFSMTVYWTMSRVQTHRAQTSSGKENQPPASKNVSQERNIVLDFRRMTQQMRQSQKLVRDQTRRWLIKRPQIRTPIEHRNNGRRLSRLRPLKWIVSWSIIRRNILVAVFTWKFPKFLNSANKMLNLFYFCSFSSFVIKTWG